MHSSWMRTVRCSGLLWGGEGVAAWGCLFERGCLPEGGLHPTWTQRQIPLPLWKEFLTHACENVTFLHLLLWAVIR